MQLSKETKYLLLGAVILSVLYLLYKKNSAQKQKGCECDSDEEIEHFGDDGTNSLPDNVSTSTSKSGTTKPSTTKSVTKKATVKPVSTTAMATKTSKVSKATTKMAKSTKKPVNKNAKPEQSGDWTTMFDNSNPFNNNEQDGDFAPVGSDTSQFARYSGVGNKDLSPEELFNTARYLPQETNNDWFEVPHDPVSIKNRHLIQITRPTSVDSICTSLKYGSHDLRGNEPCPKMIVSPWGNSSVEPDYNIRSWCKK